MALALANVVVGLSGIGAGVGFTIRENDLMDDLNEKADKLKNGVTEAGNLYDHVYYLVAVNIERLRKSVDRLPSDFIAMVQEDIDDDLKSSEFQHAIAVAGQVLGYSGAGLGLVGGILELVQKWRSRGPRVPEGGSESNPWRDVDGLEMPLADPAEAGPAAVEPTTVPRSTRLVKIAKGVNIAGIVFSALGLGATIGLGIWTVDKLEQAISDVETKQKQVTAFKKDMTDVLDELITAAGLPSNGNYDELIKMAATWKEISQHFESYETIMYYAIKEYFLHHSLDKVKAKVQKYTDANDKPFPEEAYPLANSLADDIRVQFDKGKTDKEVINFFATDNPKIGLRFVFNGFFIGSLRDIYDIQKG